MPLNDLIRTVRAHFSSSGYTSDGCVRSEEDLVELCVVLCDSLDMMRYTRGRMNAFHGTKLYLLCSVHKPIARAAGCAGPRARPGPLSPREEGAVQRMLVGGPPRRTWQGFENDSRSWRFAEHVQKGKTVSAAPRCSSSRLRNAELTSTGARRNV